jgi:chromodomain protein Y
MVKFHIFMIADHFLGRSPKNASQDQSDMKQKVQSPRPGVKVPGLHLTSQIASTAEVNEVLKERLREKQKDLVVPKTADIVFVKKITQRLSSQLSAASGCNVPPLIPLQSVLVDSDNDKEKTIEEASTESSKTVSTTVVTATDNKELLAILEGDVDPDWSNLKPQTITEDGNKVTSSGDFHNTGR